MNLFRLAFAVLIASLSVPGVALAAEPLPTLTPVAITAEAGTIAARVSPIPVLVTSADEMNGHVRVDNISTLDEDITIRVADYSVDQAGKPVAAPADFAFGSASWYRFTTPDFALPSGMTLDVPFELVIPAGAGAGDHFAALVVTVTAQPGQVTPAKDGASARTVLVFQSRLQHRIDGARPALPTVALTGWADPGVAHFTAHVRNGGNTVLGHQAAPTPTLDLYNLLPWGDAGTPELTLPVAGFYVAPESLRDVAIDWADAPLFGQYRAVFTLPAADGQPAMTAETTLMIINTPALAVIAFGLLLVVLLVLLVVRRRRPRSTLRRAIPRPRSAGAPA